MSAILFCTFYILLFSAIILKSKLFNGGNIPNRYFLGVFYLKLLFGVALYYIYTHIYKNRVTSDIFKYYDDARMMFGTLHINPKDFLSLLTSIGDKDIHFQAMYHSMNSWDNGYDSTLYNNSHFIIRLNALLMFFSHEHYGVHVIFFCFISLVGMTYIYKAFLPFLQDRTKLLFAAVFLFPSVILWSSGILKEALVWLGLGLSVYYFFKLVVSGQWPVISRLTSGKYIILILIGFAILFEAKAYTLLCLIPCFIAQILIAKIAFCKTRPGITYLLVLLVYLSASMLPRILLGKVNPLQMIADKQMDFNRTSKGGIYMSYIKYGNMADGNEYALINVADSTTLIPLTKEGDSLLHKQGIQYLASNPIVYREWTKNSKIPFVLKRGTSYSHIKVGKKDTLHLIASDSTVYWLYSYIEVANSRLYIEPIKPTFTSLLTHIPSALNISMLQPYPWHLHSAMTAIYCCENIFVLFVIILAFFFIKRPIPNKDIVLLCLLYSLMMLVLIGLVTPILGGIERYKSVVIPFMFILLLLITKQNEKRKVKSEK